MSEFSEHLARVVELVKEQGARPWREVGIVRLPATAAASGRLSIERSAVQTLAAFEAEWAGLIADGYSWINVGCLGIDGERLLISVETSRGRGQPGRTSINVSGASMGVVENDWKASFDVDLA
jgi:hypothetical protein